MIVPNGTMSCCHGTFPPVRSGAVCPFLSKQRQQIQISNSVIRQPDSLLDITSRIVAENEPFQRIEERYNRIPEPVQRRIIYWSFPRNERDICMYSSLTRVSSLHSGDSQNLSFCKGLRLLETGCVENVLQVGFHLSGVVWTYPQNDLTNTNSIAINNRSNSFVHNNGNNLIGNHQQHRSSTDRDSSNNGGVNYSIEENKKYKVSVSFDRCKIISVTCSCDTKDIFWCHHVVALSLYRIRNAETVKLRVPISETLLQMNRQQLQKFIQYLISEHQQVLPTAQKLADEILQQKSEINAICGAPDPTAGASTDDDHSWHLDETQVCEAVRNYLGQVNYYTENKPLNPLFAKVREMLRAQDSNGARMLTLITEQLLNDPRSSSMNDKNNRQLWDQLGALWVCIVLNPRANHLERQHWKSLLEKWSKNKTCPQEDPDYRPLERENYRDQSHRVRERDRNRFFRENNIRNMIFNQPPVPPPQRHVNNYNNDENFDSSESDSDSADSEAEENDNENENENNVIAVNQVDPIEPINFLNDLPRNVENDVRDFDDNSRINFDIPMLGENSGCGINVDIILPPENDDSSRESMEVDEENEVELGNINLDEMRIEMDGSSDNIPTELEFEKFEKCNCNNLTFRTSCNSFCKNSNYSCQNSHKNCDKESKTEKLTTDILTTEKIICSEINDEIISDKNNCRCIIKSLDHINGHSSKMINEIPSTNKCLCNNKDPEQPETIEPQIQMIAEDIPIELNINRGNVRPRDNDIENIRPIKKIKLNNGNSSSRNKIPRSIFHKALDAVNMTWDNQHLKNILAGDNYVCSSQNSVQIAGSSKTAQTANTTSVKSNFNSIGQPLWHEQLQLCAARIDSLRSHGHTDAALRLSVSVVRTMKQIQKDAQILWLKYQVTLGPQTNLDTEVTKKTSCCTNCDKETSSITPSTKSTFTMVRQDYQPNLNKNVQHQNCRCYDNKICGSGYDGPNHNYFNNFGGPHPPPMMRNNFNSFNNHRMYEPPHLHQVNNFNMQRYSNNTYPMNSISNSIRCHSDQCGFSRRLQPEQFYNPTRQNCSRDLERLSIENRNRCECNNEKCEKENKINEPSTSAPSTSSNTTSVKETNKKDEPETNPVKICTEHSKNQCCIKKFCCDVPKSVVNLPPCSKCPISDNLTKFNCKNEMCSRPLSHSCYPARNFYKEAAITERGYPFCNRSRADRYAHLFKDNNSYNEGSRCQKLQNTESLASSSKVNPSNAINFGASTSKNIPSTTTSLPTTITPSINEFVRNKKPGCVSNCLDCTVGCEVEFALDAVACIFDCLTEACIITEYTTTTNSLTFDTNEENSILPTRYQHISVPASNDRTETYLTLAFDAAILALGKQRIMPQGFYSQDAIYKQQDQLISRLRHIDLDRALVEVLKNLTIQLLDGGPTSGFGISIHPESVPMHTLSRFLFASLLNQFPDLAFQSGLRAMRLPVLEDINEAAVENNGMEADSSYCRDGFVLSRYRRWWTLSTLESQQCSLSSTMLSAAKGDPIRLSAVLKSARKNIHSSQNLFKLAQDAFRFATPESGPRNQTLLGVAFELGLQVARMTVTCSNSRRRETVRWLVTCASQLGLDALISIMQNWYQLFTPMEATGPVATTIMSHSTIMRLNLNYQQQDELSTCARTLALQCATKDPPNCALNALTLCENDPVAFETAYQIVIDAASNIMTSSQLFTIARYMEHRGYPMRAYKLAILAMKNVHLAYNQDTHPAINDIYWACALSHSLGKAELANMIPIVIKNVQCATVLSDILRRCSVPSPGMSHFNVHSRNTNMRPCQKLSYDRAPLRQLLEAAVTAYVNTTHSRLSHISPRHYGDFIDFLSKARDTFILARDGPAHFTRLIENITVAYKGKKKLVRQVKQRFQFV